MSPKRVVEGSEKLYGTLIQKVPAAIAMVDREMKYLAASDFWLSDYGLTGQNIVGKGHYEIFPEIPQRWKDLHQRGLQGEELSSDQDVFERADGAKQYLRWRIDPWYDSQGKVGGLVMFSEDITAAVTARLGLEQSIRLAALGEMAGGIAHEINNPLAIISGNCEGLKVKIKTLQIDDQVLSGLNTDIDRIQRGVRRISKIVQSMSSLSREPDMEMIHDLDLTDVMVEVLDLCRQKFIDHRVALTVTPIADFFVRGESTGLIQVFTNLLNNAFHAVRAGAEKRVEIEIQKAGDRALIWISDSGPGVPVALRGKIFNPFFTTKAPAEGTGLGLTVSQSILAKMGGKIVLEQPAEAEAATKLKGARFRVELIAGHP